MISYIEISSMMTVMGKEILRALESQNMKVHDIKNLVDLHQHKVASEIARLESSCLIRQMINEDKRFRCYEITTHGIAVLGILKGENHD